MNIRISESIFELSRFFWVGILSVLIDLITYLATHHYLCFGIYLSKACGFIAGTILSFYANQVWTFRLVSFNNRYLGKFLGLYALAFIVNVQLNHALYLNLSYENKTQIAFLVATTVSAALNFCGMKWFVFVNKN